MAFSIGVILISTSIIIYFLKKLNKLVISVSFLHFKIKNFGSSESQILTNLEIISNHLKNTIGISENELFEYMNEARKVISKLSSQ